MIGAEKIGDFPRFLVTCTKQGAIDSDYEIPQRIPCEAPIFNRHIPILKFTLTPTKQSPKNFSIVTHLAEGSDQAILTATMPDEENSASPLFVNRNIPELETRLTP